MSAPLLSELLQASAEGCSVTWGQGYGHLSIGTVTVAEDLATHCPQCSSAHPCWALQEQLQEEMETSEKEAYRGLQFDSSSSSIGLGLGSGRLLLGNEMPLQDSFPSGPASWASHPPFGSPAGGPEGFFGLLPAPSLLSPCLPVPAPEEGLCGRGPQRKASAAGDPQLPTGRGKVIPSMAWIWTPWTAASQTATAGALVMGSWQKCRQVAVATLSLALLWGNLKERTFSCQDMSSSGFSPTALRDSGGLGRG
ncbi:hypothetical protein L345_13308, partial [Ophiophagus hannah]